MLGHILEDDLNSLANGRQPQLFRQMEDDLNFLGKWKTTLTVKANGSRPQLFR